MVGSMFGIEKGNVVCITGSGGKTSLMYFMAKKLSLIGRVLMTTTTKIYEPSKEIYEKMLVEDKIYLGKAKNIIVSGKKIEDGKLLGHSYEEIDDLRNEFDFILIEGDGAKRKPMKGWNEKEPCIPSFTDVMIGVTSVKVLGKSIDEKIIHRIENFSEVTEEKKGTKIDEKILEKYIKTGKFFDKNKGRRIIYLNGIEKIEEIEAGIKLRKNIENLYMGSMIDKWITKVKTIDAVIMASGYSKRFGSEKLFEDIDGMYLVEHTLKKILDLPFDRIIVVGRDKRIEEMCSRYNCEYVENKKAHLGQSESVKLGTKRSTGDGVMFFPGDQVMLTKESILTLMKKFEKKDEIVRPIVDGQPSSPVIFPRRYVKELLMIEGDSGGREVLKKAKKVCKVKFEDINEFIDVDTRKDLEKIKGMLSLKSTLKKDGR